MDQISLFAGDFAVPEIADLGGILAAHGQITRGPGGAALSILLTGQDGPWRAHALAEELAARALNVSTAGSADADGEVGPGAWLLRTERTTALDRLAVQWTQGSVKTVPAFPQPPGGFLRCWALAAGRPSDDGYLLGVDERASQTYAKLAAALSGCGVTGAVIGHRGGGPGIRITGRRRLLRLAEYIGDLGPDAPRSVRVEPERSS